MCLIIDTNTLSAVFNRENANHEEFKPVLDWVISGRGKVIYGGSRYMNESQKFWDLFIELRRLNSAVFIENDCVDNLESIVSSMLSHRDFDDQHLVSLLIKSKSKLICSLDERAYQFFTHSLFFTSSKKRPKIYSGKRNKTLLNDNNIVDVCMPCIKMTKKQQKEIIKKI